MTESIPLTDLQQSQFAKFENIGDRYSGRIVGIDKRPQTDLTTGQPKYFKSGDPMMLWVITIKPEQGEAVALYAKGGRYAAAKGSGESMLSAIGAAVRSSGATSVDVGGMLAVEYTGDGEPKPGMNAPKLYAAQYQPPAPEAASVSVDDLFS